MYLAPLFLIFLTSFSSFVFSFDFSNSELRRELKIQAQNGQRTLSYDQARQNLFGKIYLERDNKGFFINDVYCYDQVRNGVGPKKIPNHAVINVEHSWPQSRFSSHAPLGVQKTDLHHLFPADSKANSKRANHIFGEVIVGVDPTDDCQESKIGYIENTIAFMPPAEIRGDIARALFYFSVRYEIAISDLEEYYLRQWHDLDPVSDQELSRHEEISKVQGNRNPFIDNPHLVHQIENF